MAWHASAKKRLRRDTKKSAMNKARIHSLRTYVKKAKASLHVDDIRRAQKELNIAASKGVIHRNTAGRRISRLMKKAATQQKPE